MKSDLSAFARDSYRVGSLALAGIAVFALVCLAAQLVRSDLDWVRAPLSSYLRGEYGWIVKTAYFVLGASLILLGLGYYRALSATARSGAPFLLFALGGVALDVTALADSGSLIGPRALEAFLHNLAAATAFLSVTMAMLLQSWRLRSDALWRHRFFVAFTLAAVCFVALWMYSLSDDWPRGLSQKVVIVLILAWLALAARWLQSHGVVPVKAVAAADAAAAAEGGQGAASP
jgi:hypothetical protein